MPLCQYLKRNTRLLVFHIDPDVGDILDGLMPVDLTQVEGRTADRQASSVHAACVNADSELRQWRPFSST